MGMEYGKQGKYPEALEALATAERLNPKFEMTYVYRGTASTSCKATKLERPRSTGVPWPSIDLQFNQAARDGLTRLGQ